MSDSDIKPNTPEEAVELGLRKAIRTAIQASNIGDAKISCFWLPDEFDEDDTKGKVPPYVFIEASPGRMSGYRSKLRDIPVSITCVTLPDGDKDGNGKRMRDLYPVVRGVIDSEAFKFPEPIKAQGFTVDESSVGPTTDYMPMATFIVTFRIST